VQTNVAFVLTVCNIYSMINLINNLYIFDKGSSFYSEVVITEIFLSALLAILIVSETLPP